MQKKIVVSRYSHIKTSFAMSTVYPWYLMSRCPVPRCRSPQSWWSRDVRVPPISVALDRRRTTTVT